MSSERGSASVAILGGALAILGTTGIALGLGASLITQHRVAGVVDHAALAASDVSRGVVAGEPCQMARELLAQASVQMVLCDELEDSVVIQGRVEGGLVSFVATARAGVLDGGEK